MTLDYAALKALPAATEYVTLECISNIVGGNQISTGLFTGVRLADLLSRAQPQPSATAVNFTAVDGYTETLPLAMVTSSPEILVVYELDGAALPTQHGYPARILIPGHYGMKGPKWLDQITLAATAHGGYWEDEGWDRQAVVRTMSRIDSPQDGATVRVGAVTVGGIAFAGKRGISMVELSTDGGSTWRPAEVQAPLSPFTWVQWRAVWHPTAQGAAALQVRATDGAGQLQSPGPAASFPAGSAGYHTARVSVGS
jgi:DMSO/TMAO reductase YedYZ molybdopterin-dependent catalytic subunit